MLCLTDALSKLFSGFLKKSEIFTHLKHLFASTLSQVCPCHHSASDLPSLSLHIQPLTCHHSACVFSFRLAIAQPASSASDLPSLSLRLQLLTCHRSACVFSFRLAITRFFQWLGPSLLHAKNVCRKARQMEFQTSSALQQSRQCLLCGKTHV